MSALLNQGLKSLSQGASVSNTFMRSVYEGSTYTVSTEFMKDQSIPFSTE